MNTNAEGTHKLNSKFTAVFTKLMYYLTVILPLSIIHSSINFLVPFLGRHYIIDALQKLLKGKSLIGRLPDGNLLIYPLDDFKMLPIISEIYHRKIYDEKQAKNFEFICDVGAHIGLFALKISKQVSTARIITIEPNPINFKFLVRNILINGFEGRVQALNVACGERKGTAALLLSKESRGDSSTRRWHNAGAFGSVVVNVLPLDVILSKEKDCDLIKIDVEGMEAQVLRGLGNQFKKVNRLVMEIHIPVVCVTEIYEWLRNHGFTITKTQKLYKDCLLTKAHKC